MNVNNFWSFRFGGTEAATFCALTSLCNQLETDGSVDVYQVAKLYHLKRPGIWKSKDDILYLYKALESLVSSSHPMNPSQNAQPTSPVSSNVNAVPITISSFDPETVQTSISNGDALV